MKKEFFKNFNDRLRLNKISKSIIKKKIILDVNCDQSNYSWIFKKLGAREVYCFYQKKKPIYYNKKNILIKKNFVNFNFKNKKFDFIFYNGGLSHSILWKHELKKLGDICNKGGFLWLSLFGESKFWNYAKSIQKKLNNKDIENFEKVLQLREWKQNKINFLKDLFFSKKIFFTKKKIIRYLKKNNFGKIRFLSRGAKTDFVEVIRKKHSLKSILGNGEIRLLAKKL